MQGASTPSVGYLQQIQVRTCTSVEPAATSGHIFRRNFMKNLGKLAIFGAVIAMSATLTSTAHADTYGTLTFTIWNGAYGPPGVTDIASLPLPTVDLIGTYTYTGNIDFVNNSNPNTFAAFFGATNLADLTYVSGDSIATLGGLDMSTVGETGSAINTYIDITGTLSGSNLLTLSSDDGSCLYFGSTAQTGLCNSNPQDDTPSTGSPNAGTGTAFSLVYVESNGAPADLVLTGATPFSAIPEPSSLMLLGTGLLGAGGMLMRRRRLTA
jgi:hypothetical protein